MSLFDFCEWVAVPGNKPAPALYDFAAPSPHSTYTTLIYTMTDLQPYKPFPGSKGHCKELIWVSDAEC